TLHLSRRCDRGEISHRTTADKKAASFSIESKNLTDPIDRHAFQLHRRRRRTPDRKISVQRRGEQIGKRCHCSSGRLHVTKHAWMSVLTAKRDNGLAKNFKQTLKIDSFVRKRGVESVADLP